MREVVAGDHDQVGVGGGELGDPALLAVLTRGEVQVGQVQHAQRLGLGREHGYVEAAQREHVALDQRGVRERGGAEDGGTGGQPAQYRAVGHACQSIGPQRHFRLGTVAT